MDEDWVKQIQKKMNEMNTEELQAIWVSNDHKEWSNEAFEAVRRLLMARGAPLPKQDELIPEPPPSPAFGGRLVIKNPFWAGFAMGIAGSWFGSLVSGLLAIILWFGLGAFSLINTTRSGSNFSAFIFCLLPLIAFGVLIGFVRLAGPARVKAGYPEASNTGVVCGAVVYGLAALGASFYWLSKNPYGY